MEDDLLDNLINEYPEPTDESKEIVLDAISLELITQLKGMFPDSVRDCENVNDLYFTKGIQHVITFLADQHNKQIDRG